MRTPNLLLLACVFASAGAIAACGQTTDRTPAPSAVATPSPSPEVPSAGQTDTDWGRIWDSLPADFPIYAGATASEEAATEPASATLVVDGDVAKDVTAWTAGGLVSAGVAVTTDTQGPLEDGGYVLEATGEGGCQVQVTAAPLGSVTTITILYGATCPTP